MNCALILGFYKVFIKIGMTFTRIQNKDDIISEEGVYYRKIHTYILTLKLIMNYDLWGINKYYVKYS